MPAGKKLPTVTKNGNYPQPVKHAKPMALRVLVPPGSSLQDDQLILELCGIQGNGRPDIKLTQEINLLLEDDPSPYKQALDDRLEQLHQSLSGWVLPRIFATADGNTPPILISFRPPE